MPANGRQHTRRGRVGAVKRAWKRARWFIENGYSAARTSELTGVRRDVVEKMKNGWPQDSPSGLQARQEDRQAGQVQQGQERIAAYRRAEET